MDGKESINSLIPIQAIWVIRYFAQEPNFLLVGRGEFSDIKRSSKKL
jgi:hypothetical protein